MPTAAERLPAYLPEPSPPKHWEDALRRLHRARQTWTERSVQQRIDLLEVCLNGVRLEAKDWVREACRARGVALDSPAAGEEWLAGPAALIRTIRLLIRALKAGGQPALPATRQRMGGRQWVAEVFPASPLEKAALPGVRAEVWIAPGQDIAQGGIYRGVREHRGQVCLVLGAGNASSIAPMDVLHKLFVEDCVVLLKMSPVNAYVGPYITRAFWRLIEENFFTVVYGDAAVGAALCRHPLVDRIHITGSAAAHDAIAWGGAERADRINRRPITSALGCVTPVIVAPGQWTEAELAFQGRHIASMATHNGGHSCTSAQVLVLPAGWPQKDALLAAVASSMAQIPRREAGYPGAEARLQAIAEAHPTAQRLGAGSAGSPWLLITGLAARADEPLLTTEAFCGVLAVVELPGHAPADFLPAAVSLCNTTLWGNLSAALLVCAAQAEDPAIEQAVAALRYGTVGVNVWPGVGLWLGSTPWGAAPGNTVEDVRSGVGVVHNAMLLERVDKTVLRAPSILRPDPSWLVDNPRTPRLGPRLVDFEAAPRWRKLPGLLAAAVGRKGLLAGLRGG